MLTAEQLERFLSEGHIVIRGAFPGAEALAWVREECARKGYVLEDPATWEKEYERFPTQRQEMLSEYAPSAWKASCDLMGGRGRVAGEAVIGLFAVNFRQGADRPYLPP